jgi:hypothetical protein
MQKSFSVFNNYQAKRCCEKCGKEARIYYQTIEGRICETCKEKAKENNKPNLSL